MHWGSPSRQLGSDLCRFLPAKPFLFYFTRSGRTQPGPDLQGGSPWQPRPRWAQHAPHAQRGGSGASTPTPRVLTTSKASSGGCGVLGFAEDSLPPGVQTRGDRTPPACQAVPTAMAPQSSYSFHGTIRALCSVQIYTCTEQKQVLGTAQDSFLLLPSKITMLLSEKKKKDSPAHPPVTSLLPGERLYLRTCILKEKCTLSVQEAPNPPLTDPQWGLTLREAWFC